MHVKKLTVKKQQCTRKKASSCHKQKHKPKCESTEESSHEQHSEHHTEEHHSEEQCCEEQPCGEQHHCIENHCKKCYLFELVENSIDFDSEDDHPKAKLTLLCDACNCKKSKITCVCITYRALVRDMIDFMSEKICVELDEDGNFEFEIPQNTYGLEVTVTINTSHKCCTKIQGIYPGNCKPNFSVARISTRLMALHCTQMAIDTSGLDHTPLQPGENRVFGHQLGPCRSARAMAIVHIGIFEALLAVVGGYQSYLGLSSAPVNTSAEAAMCRAAYDTLVGLYPSHAPRLSLLAADLLAQIPDGPGKAQGLVVGSAAAQAILTLRANDGSNHAEPVVGVDYIPSGAPGEWDMDPISQIPKAVGALWSQVTPFVIPAANTYRCPAPPALNSVEYMMAYDEAKALGGDGVITPTTRSEEQTFIGTFWAYDGTPSLCAPPRLYNQIAMQIASDQGLDTIQMCRMLALINVGMADTALAAWESKYYYKFWRPVTAIRGGLTDGNSGTIGDVNWTPLGAPASNLTGPNFSPPFCSTPSGHSSIAPCLFQILRHVFGRDDIQFTFISDEYNGITKDNQGNIRPYRPRTFNSLSQAEDENGESRIYLGIHFKFDKTYGIPLGHSVADDVYAHLYQPL